MRNLWALMLIAMVAGCTADAYERSADRQVRQILRDREQRTLNYEPKVEVAAGPATAPTPKAYDRIPVTRLPPPTTAPLEPRSTELPAAPLGPSTRWINLPPMDPSFVGADEPLRPGRGVTYGPPAPSAAGQRFDLLDCLAFAVRHSRSYRDQLDDLYLSALDVTLQRYLFEPRPFARLGYGISDTQSDTDYQSALTATANAGVRQKLPYGGEVVASALTRFVNVINGNATDGESAQVVLEASVPLLRGAGMVNLEPLIASERQVVYQVRAFESFRRSFVVNIASRYFRLLAQQQSVSNRRQNLRNLTALTERTRALYAAGRISFLEVQRSLQARLTAESLLLDAQDAYTAAVDEFKIVLGMSIEQDLTIVPVDLAVSVPPLDDRRAIDLAMQYRLELQTARDRVDDAQRSVAISKNSLLPDLDISGRASVGNPAGSPASHLDLHNRSYSAQVTLDLPVDRVAERNTYRAALIGLQAAQRAYEQRADEVADSVRDALRAIRNAQLSLQIQQRGIELAQRRLEFSSELLRQGRINARDVVEAQSSLLDAQDRYELARSQLHIRVLEYLRDTGLLRVDPNAGSLGAVMNVELSPVSAPRADQTAPPESR